MIVFDFDCTLTKKHIRSKEDLPSVEHDALRSGIRNLRASGYRVSLASYGHKGLIEQTLKDAGVYEDVELVVTPNTVADMYGVAWEDGYNPRSKWNLDKTTMLNIITDKTGLKKTNVLLVDDSYGNVTRAESNGYHAVCVVACEGVDSTLAKVFKTIAKIDLFNS